MKKLLILLIGMLLFSCTSGELDSKESSSSSSDISEPISSSENSEEETKSQSSGQIELPWL